MPKNQPPDIVPLILQKWSPRFEALDYALDLGGPYDFAVPLQAAQQEAGAKGMGVVVMVALVPLEDIYGPNPDTETGDQPYEPQP